MIIEVEKLIFDFLVEKLKDKKVTVYHGLLPEIKVEIVREGEPAIEYFNCERDGADNLPVLS